MRSRSRVSVSAGSLCPLLHRLFVGEAGTCILRHGTSNVANDVVVSSHRRSSQILNFSEDFFQFTVSDISVVVMYLCHFHQGLVQGIQTTTATLNSLSSSHISRLGVHRW